MGAKAVSAVQYDQENMQASIKVLTEEKSPGHDEPLMTFTLIKVTDDVPTERPSVESVAEGLRKREVTTKEEKDLDDEKVGEVTDRVEEVDIETKEKPHDIKEKPQGSPRKDPLNWFGVLVPQALRDSQSQFKSALSFSADLATLKIKLLKMQMTIRHLLHRKEEIINSFDDSGFVIYDDSSLFSSQSSSLGHSNVGSGQAAAAVGGSDR